MDTDRRRSLLLLFLVLLLLVLLLRHRRLLVSRSSKFFRRPYSGGSGAGYGSANICTPNPSCSCAAPAGTEDLQGVTHVDEAALLGDPVRPPLDGRAEHLVRPPAGPADQVVMMP